MSTDPATGAPAPAPDPMAALVDIRNQVIRLGQEVAALRSEQPAPSPDAINSVTAELREAVRFLAERLDGVARMVAQRGEELADTRGALGAIDAHVRSQAETIGVLTTGMQALPPYGQQVAGLQDTLNSLQQRLGGIEASLGQRLGGIEQALARPADAQISERLAAIEGMLGPLAQRLAHAHNDHAASLQSLNSKVESIAAGTQAALAQPAVIDEAALAGLDPKLSALSGEIQSLRSDVAAVVAARAASEGSPPPAVDLSPLAMQLSEVSGEIQSLRSDVASFVAARASADASGATVDLSPLSKQLSDLADHVAALGSAPRGEGAPAAAGDQDVDAAIGAAEQRIIAHVDDAIFALAQTLLGRNGAVALVDAPAQPAAPPSAARPTVAAAGDADVDESDVDEGDDDDHHDDHDHHDQDDHDDDHDRGSEAQIDFSRAELDDEDDTVSWERPAAPGTDQRAARWGRPRGFGDEEPSTAEPQGSAPAPAAEAPFDEEAWGSRPSPHDGPATVVPERRRRWFSW